MLLKGIISIYAHCVWWGKKATRVDLSAHKMPGTGPRMEDQCP